MLVVRTNQSTTKNREANKPKKEKKQNHRKKNI